MGTHCPLSTVQPHMAVWYYGETGHLVFWVVVIVTYAVFHAEKHIERNILLSRGYHGVLYYFQRLKDNFCLPNLKNVNFSLFFSTVLRSTDLSLSKNVQSGTY